jgi:hypothetical protein
VAEFVIHSTKNNDRESMDKGGKDQKKRSASDDSNTRTKAINGQAQKAMTIKMKIQAHMERLGMANV